MVNQEHLFPSMFNDAANDHLFIKGRALFDLAEVHVCALASAL